MAFTHHCALLSWHYTTLIIGLNIKRGHLVNWQLCTHPVAADGHDIIIQALLMWKHGTMERDTQRGTWVMRARIKRGRRKETQAGVEEVWRGYRPGDDGCWIYYY